MNLQTMKLSKVSQKKNKIITFRLWDRLDRVTFLQLADMGSEYILISIDKMSYSFLLTHLKTLICWVLACFIQNKYYSQIPLSFTHPFWHKRSTQIWLAGDRYFFSKTFLSPPSSCSLRWSREWGQFGVLWDHEAGSLWLFAFFPYVCFGLLILTVTLPHTHSTEIELQLVDSH